MASRVAAPASGAYPCGRSTKRTWDQASAAHPDQLTLREFPVAKAYPWDTVEADVVSTGRADTLMPVGAGLPSGNARASVRTLATQAPALVTTLTEDAVGPHALPPWLTSPLSIHGLDW